MDERKYLIWLSQIYDVNADNMDNLLRIFGSPYEIYKARPSVIEAEKRISPVLKDRVLRIKRKSDINEICEYMAKHNIGFISKYDENYPPLLREIDNPPLGIYFLGNMPSYDLLWIGVIGTRKPSAYGKSVVLKISEELAGSDTVIVSGLAEGLDALAHQGALKASGHTLAVLGCGVDICYPSFNIHIYRSIIEKGAVISEFPPGTQPKPWHFPLRNRIISGLCHGIAVVEAGLRSGTLITADYALEQGREVFAVPGNITSKESLGTNALIKDGAHVITCAADVLDVFGGIGCEVSDNILSGSENKFNEEINNIESIPLAPDEKTVYALLGSEPIELEDILLESGLSYQSAAFALTNLELSKRIKKLPGQRYTL